jgi:hypothetical protein
MFVGPGPRPDYGWYEFRPRWHRRIRHGEPPEGVPQPGDGQLAR